MRLFVLLSLCFVLVHSDTKSQAQTNFGAGTGEYQELFNDVKGLLLKSKYRRTRMLGGKERTAFVSWIRDHVHVMKAMKYFVPDISSFWEYYMQTQTPEGLYFDYYYPIANHLNIRMNVFDKRYWHIFSNDSIQMHRLPVEADLEYLLVEGAYDVWQATGDNDYIKSWTDGLEKGLHYSMTDPLRWSKKYQLVKRGYTLDTWDFLQLPSRRDEYVRQGNDLQEGIFDIHENTPMGIMHGDNSGMYAACNQLSLIFSSLGNETKSKEWKEQADLFRTRTNALCWNGSYYAHFVPVDPMPAYLHIDQKNTLSLSNPYDINRGLPTQEMAASIIKTYRQLKEKNELNSFAEWFGIYPPVRPHFADYEPGSYMNGGVNTIVGGELAKAALQHGFETYGVDILNRMLELVRKHNGDLPVAYKPDGTVDEGIPDKWGQAAVMSALIEGLAGVIDKGQLFREVEISPRWLAAGRDDAEITIAYGPSGKSVSYSYAHNKANKTITLQFSGDPQLYTVRLLLPAGKKQASAKLDGQNVNAGIDQIESSYYAVVKGVSEGKHELVVRYK